MLGDDSSGWQKANFTDVANLDPLQLAEVATKKATESAKPQEVAPGKYTVILEPAAVLDMVGFMFYDFGGLAILDQRSFLNNRIGKKLFGENINVFDDVAHPLQSGSPFDGEGVQRQKIQLVENGVVKRVVYARATGPQATVSQSVLLETVEQTIVGKISETNALLKLEKDPEKMSVYSNLVFGWLSMLEKLRSLRDSERES